MSLTPIESVSAVDYFKGGVFSGGTHYYWVGSMSAPPQRGILYVDRTDTLVHPMARITPSDVGTAQFDPLFLDNTAPLAKMGSFGPLQMAYSAIGEWDKVNGIQKIYGGINAASAEIWPVDQSTLVMTDIGASLFPFNWDAWGGGGVWVNGSWDDNPTGTMNSDMVLFETWGKMLRVAQCQHTDGNPYRGLILVDLVTTLGELLDVPIHFSNAPAALFESYLFQGDAFVLDGLQFVADDDSQLAAPKGRIFLHSSEFLSVLGDVDDTDWRQYMKIIEWNPLGIAATPGNSSRVHLREVLMTRLNFIERQAFGTNPNSLGHRVGVSANGNLRTRFHPPSRTFITANDVGNVSELERGYVRHSLAPALAEVQTPTALQEVETAKTIRFRARGLGDIGDVVGGASAVWSIERRSTIGEEFDTSSGSETFVDVANPAIDADSLIFYYLGTPLTITTDYTVNEGTGRITGAGAHATLNASGYTADYRHSNTGATPAHGTLLQLTGRTDELGHAETRVQYPDDDDLESDRDRITCELSD